jgi:SAM-dependent methyltransferase
MTYLKEAFYPQTLQQAKDVCLTPDTSEWNKFENETEFLVDFMMSNNWAKHGTLIGDFGCGMGRISKPLCDQLLCRVVGFDISEAMLEHAIKYVDNPKFMPELYDRRKPLDYLMKLDLFVAALVLQHSEDPVYDIKFMKHNLKQDGHLVVLNEQKRLVPSDVDKDGYVIWRDDGIDINAELGKEFTLVGEYPYYKGKPTLLTVWKK